MHESRTKRIARRLAIVDRIRETSWSAPLLAGAAGLALVLVRRDARKASRVPITVFATALAGGLAFARPRLAGAVALVVAPPILLFALATDSEGPYAVDGGNASYSIVFVLLGAAAGARLRRRLGSRAAESTQ